MTDLSVITICGSLRKTSYNAALARQLPKFAPPGMKITAGPSIEPIPHFNQDVLDREVPPAVAAFVDAIRAADGLIVVSPEFNWSIPGVLKNAIDWASRGKNQPFMDKPVSIQSVATGLLGGSRMQYHMRQSLAGLGALMLVRPEIFVTMAAQKFDKETLELTDRPTVDLIREHLANFDKFVRKTTGKL